MRPVQRHGGVDIFRATSPFQRVIVEEVEGGVASCRDLSTGGDRSVQATTPSGRLPRPGEVWFVSNELGVWTFHKLLDPAPGPVMTGAMDVMRESVERREYPWAPFESTRDVAETPMWAHIGERRLFDRRPSERWLLVDGSNKSRSRYRLLFEEIGTTYGAGDGSTTFGLPTQSDMGSVLSDSDYYSVTGGSDPTLSTTPTLIPGLTHSLTIPSSPTQYEVEVHATIAVQSLFSGGLPDSEVVLRVDGVDYSSGGFSHSLEYQPVANGLLIASGMWKVTFGSDGAHTIALFASKNAATGTVSIVRKNSHMSCKLFVSGGSASSGGASWYILAE